MQFVTREETEELTGWILRIRLGDNSPMQKNFLDSEYGGKEGALRAAQDYFRGLITPKITFTSK